MVTLNLDKWFKKYNFDPSNDSDGGSDYVDGVDSVDAAKLNHQFKGKNEVLHDLELFLEVLNNSLSHSRILGSIRDDLDDNLPFQLSYDSGSLRLMMQGLPNALIATSQRKVMLPNIKFIDFIDPENLQFAIYAGLTNLFEIQTNYPTTSKRWYRLGHDGAESPAQEVKVKTNFTSTDYAFIDVIFNDYMNNPTGHPQVIRVENTVSGTYLELVLENGETNYRINAVTDNGGVYTNVDSGIPRTIGEHRAFIIVNEFRTMVMIDFAMAYQTGDTHFVNGINQIGFESRNSSGSADYFDILRFDVCKSIDLGMVVANNVYWVSLSVLTGNYSISTTKPTGNANILLYEINIPTGATGILPAYITDLRNLSQMIKQFALKDGKIDTLTSTTINATTGNITTVSSTTVNATNLSDHTLQGDVTGNNKNATGYNNLGATNVNGTNVAGTNGNFTNLGATKLVGAVDGNAQDITNIDEETVATLNVSTNLNSNGNTTIGNDASDVFTINSDTELMGQDISYKKKGTNRLVYIYNATGWTSWTPTVNDFVILIGTWTSASKAIDVDNVSIYGNKGIVINCNGSTGNHISFFNLNMGNNGSFSGTHVKFFNCYFATNNTISINSYSVIDNCYIYYSSGATTGNYNFITATDNCRITNNRIYLSRNNMTIGADIYVVYVTGDYTIVANNYIQNIGSGSATGYYIIGINSTGNYTIINGNIVLASCPGNTGTHCYAIWLQGTNSIAIGNIANATGALDSQDIVVSGTSTKTNTNLEIP